MCQNISILYVCVDTFKKDVLCLTEGTSSAVPYALLSERLSGSTLGCCKSPHKVFIRLNLGTLLPLAFELVNSDQGRRKGREGVISGLPHLKWGLLVHQDYRIKSATLWSTRPTVEAAHPRFQI